jgi:hypothetical protein
MKELAREYPPPTISTRIWDSCTRYIWGIGNYKHSEEAERRPDPIDSSTSSHQDEGNSGIVDPIDSTSDYLPDQLKFFFNQLRLRQRWGSISNSHHIKAIVDSLKSEHVLDWFCVTSGQLWSFKLEDVHNRLHTRSDHHSPLNDGSHDRAIQDMKDFFDWKNFSCPPKKFQRIEDKNGSHRMISKVELWWICNKGFK